MSCIKLVLFWRCSFCSKGGLPSWDRNPSNTTACAASVQWPYFSFQLTLWFVQCYHRIICKISSPLPHCLMDENVPCTSWDLHYFQTVQAGVVAGTGGQAGRLSPNYPRLQFASAAFSCRVTLEVSIFVSVRKWVRSSFSWEKARKQLRTLCFNFEMVPSYSHVRKNKVT